MHPTVLPDVAVLVLVSAAELLLGCPTLVLVAAWLTGK